MGHFHIPHIQVAMKFVLSLVALALVAAVNAAPSPAFDGDLLVIKNSLADIGVAATNLGVMEANLGALELQKETIVNAEKALETAVDLAGAAGYDATAQVQKT